VVLCCRNSSTVMVQGMCTAQAGDWLQCCGHDGPDILICWQRWMQVPGCMLCLQDVCLGIMQARPGSGADTAAARVLADGHVVDRQQGYSLQSSCSNHGQVQTSQ
jgi:hypothetical protein